MVDDLDIPEAGGRQQVANFVDFRQVAVFRRQRPGDREKRRPVRAFGDFGGDEQPARFQYPAGFAVKRRLIGNVHRHVLGIGAVEAGVVERQVEGVGLPKRHPVIKPGLFGQHHRHVAEFLRQVDAGDPAAVFRGQKPRRPADARPDIEDVAAGPGRQPRQQAPGRLGATAVQVVHGFQIGDRQARCKDSRLFERRHGGLGERPVGPVLGDFCFG